MCGIAGIFEFGYTTSVQLPHALQMARAMRHRGPDDEGFVSFLRNAAPRVFYGEDTPLVVREHYPEAEASSNVEVETLATLAHRRLSIIDVSPAGHQPMRSADSRYWIAYNGEVYNYIELRVELSALGHLFRTESDTEVILAAYAEWGVDCAERFNGDWALLIYDTERHELFVSRDRFGIKPLYYYQDATGILFASEIKALLAHPRVKTSPDLGYLSRYLSSGTTEWLPETAFVDIRRFPFAHSATIDLAGPGVWEPMRYWDLKVNTSQERFDAGTAQRYAAQYLELLTDAVRLRLRSDVPIGCALSGGLDSSSIVYLANALLSKAKDGPKLSTFSSVYSSPETKHCDESYFIDLLQADLGFRSHKMEPKPDDIPRLSEIVQRHWESPPDGSGMAGINTLGLARDVGLKVTLDGQGADEVQAGYELYLVTFLGSLGWGDFFREIRAVNGTLQGSADRRKIIVAAVARKLFGVRFLSRLLKMARKNFTFGRRTLNEELRHSVLHGLVNLIHYSDSRSMYYSIESRMPFMDHRLIEFSLSVPGCYKVHAGYTKYLARLAFDGKLPDEITWRKDKMGWPVPEARWLIGPLGVWVDSVIGGSAVLPRMGVKFSDTQSLKRRIRLFNIAVWERVFWVGAK